ncbi:MAG: hypothetical protein J6A69_02635 [Clostridia bacterium]|nr:hypothetical protein [Clostridia bacterium]
MKKLISIVLVICVLTANITAMAETKEVEGLHEKLNAIILENNFTEEQIADMDAQFVEEFNWEEALDILINEGILSEEDTTAMDLFTRGDMAKIIYESMENGIF